jgi:hypothetical protein
MSIDRLPTISQREYSDFMTKIHGNPEALAIQHFRRTLGNALKKKINYKVAITEYVVSGSRDEVIGKIMAVFLRSGWDHRGQMTAEIQEIRRSQNASK